jgi:hypothetical protein
VQPGDIVEYQWREIESDVLSNYLRLPLQRSIPVQTVRYYVKPFSSEYVRIGMRSMTFHVKNKAFTPAEQGYSMLEYTNMPAFKEEPYMPPEDELRAWALVFYTEEANRVPEKYWTDYGKKVYASYRQEMKVTGEIKKVATEATAGAGTDDEKARALYAWMRKNIRNINSVDVTAEERRAAKENKSSADTLKQRLGTGYDVNILFGALATAAGLDARLALTGDRSDLFFQPSIADRYFLHGEVIAIQIGSEWKYYDPATNSLPSGAQVWAQQGVPALIPDAKAPSWKMIPLSKPEESVVRHQAQFKLDSEGAISGPVTITYTGHNALEERQALARKNATEREQYVIDEFKDQFGSPEIKDVKWAALDDAEKPLVLTFSMKATGYVQRTGKRIFMQPAVFQHGFAARFPASTRQHPVYFNYPWEEQDEISIEVPEGFEFDHPDMPAPINVGKTSAYEVKAQIEAKSKLLYHRRLWFGGDGNIVISTDFYGPLKQLFDAVHESDEHTLALKQVTK